MTRLPHLRAGLISATLVVLARRCLAARRPDPGRRRDELRHDQRHQHVAALPQRGPRRRTAGRRVPRGGHRRLPQQDAAHRRPAPHHRGQGRSFHHQGRPQRLHRSRSARPRGRGRQARLPRPARRARPALAAHPVHGRAALGRDGAAAVHGRQAAPPPPRPPPTGRRARNPPARAAAHRARRPLALRHPRARHLHHLRGGRSRLPRLRRARLHAPGHQAVRRQDALRREGQLRLPRQGLGRARVPRRRREHRRPDLRQARARRPRQDPLPLRGQGATPPRRHDGGRPRHLEPDRLEPHHPARRPPSASRATTPPPTCRSTSSTCAR